MKTVKPLVYILVLNWNAFPLSRQCIKSLDKIDYSNYKILLIDNSSQDGSIEKLKNEFPQIEFLCNKENFGYAGGNNAGIDYALNHGADYIFILNNDTEIDPNCLSECVKFAEKDNKIGALCPLILYYKKPDRIWYRGLSLRWPGIFINVDQGQLWRPSIHDLPHEVEMLTGCAMLLKRKVIEKVGKFDDKLFMYAEDADLSIRITKAGYKLYCVPFGVVWHKIDYKTKNITPLNSYYGTRNRLIILKRHQKFKFGIWVAVFLLFVKNIFQLINNGKVAKAKLYALADFMQGYSGRRYIK